MQPFTIEMLVLLLSIIVSTFFMTTWIPKNKEPHKTRISEDDIDTDASGDVDITFADLVLVYRDTVRIDFTDVGYLILPQSVSAAVVTCRVYADANDGGGTGADEMPVEASATDLGNIAAYAEGF